MGKIASSNASSHDNPGTTLRMHGDWSGGSVVGVDTIWLGLSGVLHDPYTDLVLARLGAAVNSPSMSQRQRVRAGLMAVFFQNGTLSFNKFDFVVGWLFRECSSPYLFLHALWDPAIKWRSRIYKLAWGGLAQELKPRTRYWAHQWI